MINIIYWFYWRCYGGYDKHSCQYNHCPVCKIVNCKEKWWITNNKQHKSLEKVICNSQITCNIFSPNTNTCKNVLVTWYSILLLNTIFTDAWLVFLIDLISRTSLSISYSSSVLEAVQNTNLYTILEGRHYSQLKAV